MHDAGYNKNIPGGGTHELPAGHQQDYERHPPSAGFIFRSKPYPGIAGICLYKFRNHGTLLRIGNPSLRENQMIGGYVFPIEYLLYKCVCERRVCPVAVIRTEPVYQPPAPFVTGHNRLRLKC
ncbi:hypothetical protein GCM10023092_08390 [Rurimicrobium arvi]|uniref:Uncharacterized protein n=1 Tax=Rurimicrobium arvi TaxID=2049916 RepID=A0ABP8MJ14_9BACT